MHLMSSNISYTNAAYTSHQISQYTDSIFKARHSIQSSYPSLLDTPKPPTSPISARIRTPIRQASYQIRSDLYVLDAPPLFEFCMVSGFGRVRGIAIGLGVDARVDGRS